MSEEMELPLHDDGPEEDVEIEITEEDLADDLDEGAPQSESEEGSEASAEEDEEEEEVRPKRKRSSEKRISELARRAQDAERRAQEAESRLQGESELRRQSDAAMMTHYENALSSQMGEAKRKLLEAKSLGDSEAEIDAQSEFFQAQTDLAGIKAWRAQQATEQPAQTREVLRAPAEQRPQLEPATAEWVHTNEWFQPQSTSFDAEMHEEATLYARRIERRYRADGRGDEIGSTTYFREIDKHMQEEFPDAFEGRAAPRRAAPPMSRDSRVAPVSRGGQPAQGARSGNKIRLSPEQRKFAHNMAASGAYTKSGGTRMNNEEAEKYYAVFLMKQSRS
jgi:hypothetical protein